VRRRPATRLALALALAAGVALAGCGDDGGGDGGGDDGSADDGGAAMATDDATMSDEVAVEATATEDDGTVLLDFTVTNGGDRPVAVVDPLERPGREEPLDSGAVRVSYLMPTVATGGGGGVPPEPARGVLLGPGESHSGTVRALTRGPEVPGEVELCVEVAADPYADDDGDGVVDVAPRPADDPPTLACSGPVAVG
jgi:hypothetical protein